MRRMRFAGALAVVALLAGACNGGTSATEEASPAPSAAAASPSPEASPSPAPSPSPTEVVPANDVEDPVEALEAIVAYYDYLFENPQPSQLQLIYAERCKCFEEVAAALESLRSDGQRLSYERPRVFEVVEVVERTGPFARVRYREDSPATQLISADGTVLESAPDEGQLYEVEVFLVREGGRWVVVAYA
jgi:hypothetical protein